MTQSSEAQVTTNCSGGPDLSASDGESEEEWFVEIVDVYMRSLKRQKFGSSVAFVACGFIALVKGFHVSQQ